MKQKEHEERLVKHQLKHKVKIPIQDNHKLGTCEICFPSEPKSLITEEKQKQFNKFNEFYRDIVPEATTYTPATKRRIFEACRLIQEALDNPTHLREYLQKAITVVGHVILNYEYKSRPKFELVKLAKLITRAPNQVRSTCDLT